MNTSAHVPFAHVYMVNAWTDVYEPMRVSLCTCMRSQYQMSSLFLSTLFFKNESILNLKLTDWPE